MPSWFKRVGCWTAGHHEWQYINTLFGRAYFRCHRCQVVRSRPASPEPEEKAKPRPK